MKSIKEIATKYYNRSQGGAKLSEQDFIDAITEYSEGLVNFFDMFGRKMEIGHIVAVRYAWNSYVGTIGMGGLCATGAKRHAFFSPHELKKDATYQIIGHKDKNHPDFNQEVYDWYMNEKGNCPVTFHIYDDAKIIK
jgi:hypothetical protein